MGLPNFLAVLFTKEKRHIPRITDYSENVVPTYALSVFMENYRSTLERSKALPPIFAVCCQRRVGIFLHVVGNHLPNCLFLVQNITERSLVLFVQ